MINRVVLMGRLTHDPELKTTPSNIFVIQFQIAVDRSYVKPGEERQTDFIDIVAWRKTAEFVNRYFPKGSMIAVDGSIQTNNFTDKQGNKRKSVEVVADSVSFCGSKNESQNTGGGSNHASPTFSASGFSEGLLDNRSNGYPCDFEEIDVNDDLPF